MNNPLNCVGLKCEKGYKLEVLKSAAGYYVGTLDDDGCPNCRITCYSQTRDGWQLKVERDCIENNYCNDFNINGCQVRRLER